MARVFGITLPSGIEIIYNKTLKMYDISVNCNIGKNRRFLSRKQKYNLKEFTKLYTVASAWHSLSQAEKDAWYNAGNQSGINGYSLWTQDKIYRLMNGLPGNATPSNYHQYKVGHIKIESPASSFKISEVHVGSYNTPIDFGISYHTNLTSVGSNPYAKLRLTLLSFLNGENIENYNDIDFNLVQSWTRQTKVQDHLQGDYGMWKITLEANDVVGDIYFDNLFIEFNATIQNEDPMCDKFPLYWVEENVSEDIELESIYCPD